jgi:trans-2,3-dihydro-3-hydroxyanthranilate isomerase
MYYRFYTADVFTRKRFGGNQLAVFPHAEGLGTKSMRMVARELNITETVFVFPPEDPNNTRRLRIFTPSTELPFAGHPTIGTAFILAMNGEIPLYGDSVVITLEEAVGLVKVRIRIEDGKPTFTQLYSSMKPEFGPPAPEKDILARALSLQPDDLLYGELTSQAVSCGVPFLFIPLKDLNTLSRANLNREHWEKDLLGFWAPHLFMLTFNTETKGVDLRSRVFSPGMAIDEEPASGSAAMALGGYLGSHDPTDTGTLRWTVEQGVEMGRPCIMEVEADKVNGEVVTTRVGGSCVMISEGLINITPERETDQQV